MYFILVSWTFSNWGTAMDETYKKEQDGRNEGEEHGSRNLVEAATTSMQLSSLERDRPGEQEKNGVVKEQEGEKERRRLRGNAGKAEGQRGRRR
jgi:hypothetical protein